MTEQHCNCLARLNVMPCPYEFALVLMNIERDRLPEYLLAQMILTTCTHCGAEFYVGTLALLTERIAEMERALLEINDMAQRSDAHPDLQFGPIALRGLRATND